MCAVAETVSEAVQTTVSNCRCNPTHSLAQMSIYGFSIKLTCLFVFLPVAVAGF